MARQIFAVPVAIAVVSTVGLISALAGDGVEDVASWIALSVPVVAVVWAMRARRT
ncbi:MAG: hypothetical protein V4610_00130 [Pseudomonadota bacterium]|jgi:hypothetical protein|uniref:Uncharacterized protein n=1 Tax=hydrothermal vent metagenome TaxID=652676 RepID=A0A160TG86_9ZZZZ